ncbi:lipoprotein N-acyltransferase Lnb domain-containing protein [Dyadobacter psychrotolerans]|uniref:DUF4105 domain-containing protein n=1 Tax=Dyadobacter psychrotolerans TaxID=2541721 RepID=A0A4V6PFU3_9BACT|nr:DUF4105 domain-containing protein [Dyadobacter psychrotolerans]TDE16308.1 DUF4105 domain-containing protein [Dyadobacter psychrotolerans]
MNIKFKTKNGFAKPITSKLAVLIVFSLILTHSVSAQFGTLSPSAKISLITVGPGQELYSGFGHSVLWVSDPMQGLDRAYNYGTFSFATGNFYVKFLRGTLPYSLSVGPLYQQADYWQAENRSIKEEVLNLSANQKQKLYNFLENNYLPENRLYQYKFFYDNCSTRMVTALKAACGDSLDFPGYTHEKRSFRQWIDKYAYKQNPWADFGMDLAIGAPSDDIATPEQATFLPDNLSAAFGDSKIKIGNQTLPLIASRRDIFVAQPADHAEPITPMILFWALAALVLLYTLWQIKKGNVNFTLDKILFSFVGLIGWFILLLWFGTNHGVTSYNYDIAWAFPLWLPLILFISPNKKPAWFQYLLIFYGFLLLCATGNLLKHNLVVIPIIITLIIRVYYINNSLSKIPQKG